MSAPELSRDNSTLASQNEDVGWTMTLDKIELWEFAIGGTGESALPLNLKGVHDLEKIRIHLASPA